MWEYNHIPRPDELYHWKYIKREKVGDKYRYYYKDTDKKDRTSRFGKYEYTYDDKTGYNTLTRKDRIKQDFENIKGAIEYKLGYNEREEYRAAKKAYEDGKAAAEAALDKVIKSTNVLNDYTKDGTKEHEEAYKTLTKSQKELWGLNDKTEENHENYKKSEQKYHDTTMGKIDKATKDLKTAVKNTGKNIRSTASNAIDMGKEAVNSILERLKKKRTQKMINSSGGRL